MKCLSFILFSFLLLNLSACKSQKVIEGVAQGKTEGKVTLKIDSIKSIAKKLFLLKNKKLEISERNGSLMYAIVDSDNSNVVQFFYEKDTDKVAYDGGYREEVIFEIPNNSNDKNYADIQLQNTKMLFGRYCFCRGQTGLYKVNQGTLHVKSSKKEIHFQLQFKIEEVPQVTKEVIF